MNHRTLHENRNASNNNRGKTNQATNTERQERPITEKETTTSEGDASPIQQTAQELKIDRKEPEHQQNRQKQAARKHMQEIYRRSRSRAMRYGKYPIKTMRKPDSRGNGKRQGEPRRKYTAWENVGLVEYNHQTAKWGFRFEHFQREW